MRKVKIGEITDSCLGKMLDSEKNKGEYAPYLANINVRWGSFDVENLSEMRFEAEEQERYGLIDGDLVMCEGGEPGRCAIWHNQIPNMKIQKALHRIRPHEDVDIRWLYYWFLLYGRRHLLDKFFTETTIKHLPGEKLKEIELELPDKEIQTEIADVLTAIDEKIEHNQSICAELESMAKTLYDYWFVQFDFPNENGKPYRTNGGRMIWCEELKKQIPVSWEVKKIGDLLKKTPKTTRILTEGYHNEGNIAIIDQSDKYIAGYTDDYSAELSDEDSYIVFGDHTRVVKNVRFPFARGADGTQVLSSKDERMPNELFYQALKAVDLSNQGYARHFKFLKESIIVLPNIAVAKLYKETVVPLYEKNKQLVFENVELKRLRDWLLPMLMNGQAVICDMEETMNLAPHFS